MVLTAGGFFYSGWYNWEFHRPPTAVYHNQYISGDNATVSQNKENKDRRLFIGGMATDDKTVGIVIGVLF